MLDVPGAIRDFLISVPSVVDKFGNRIWAERNLPPETYRPDSGPAIAFRIRGGVVDAPIFWPSVQFKVYGGCGEGAEITAQQCYRVLYDALQNNKRCPVCTANPETMQVTLQERDTVPAWTYVLSFWTLFIKDTNADCGEPVPC